MIYIYCIVTLLMLVVFGDSLCSIGVSNDNMIGALTYSFGHVNYLHWFINCLCLYIMYNPIRELYMKRFGQITSAAFFCVVFSAAVLAAFPAASDIPTIGGSGMVYVLLGMLLVLNPTLKQLKAYVYVVLAILFQIFFGHSNVALHICAFIAGALVIIVQLAYDQTRDHTEE